MPPTTPRRLALTLALLQSGAEGVRRHTERLALCVNAREARELADLLKKHLAVEREILRPRGGNVATNWKIEYLAKRFATASDAALRLEEMVKIVAARAASGDVNETDDATEILYFRQVKELLQAADFANAMTKRQLKPLLKMISTATRESFRRDAV